MGECHCSGVGNECDEDGDSSEQDRTGKSQEHVWSVRDDNADDWRSAKAEIGIGTGVCQAMKPTV